jgi:hypothetical protein
MLIGQSSVRTVEKLNGFNHGQSGAIERKIGQSRETFRATVATPCFGSNSGTTKTTAKMPRPR